MKWETRIFKIGKYEFDFLANPTILGKDWWSVWFGFGISGYDHSEWYIVFIPFLIELEIHLWRIEDTP